MCVLTRDLGYFAMFQMTYVRVVLYSLREHVRACIYVDMYVIMFTCLYLDPDNIIICNFL